MVSDGNPDPGPSDGIHRCMPLLADEIKQALAGDLVPFHMPGHRAGRGFPLDFGRLLSEIDTTELPGTDNLQHPAGILKEAQERAARYFGAAASHFLVNGSTVGLLAMLQAVAGPGDEILVGRDCHRSVLHALQLSGAEPVFVDVHPDGMAGVPCGCTEDRLVEAIRQNRHAKALLLTRPNYYGFAVPLKKIARLLHENGMALLVDEAHGAHFNCGTFFPEPALACGADLVVQSLHKTLPSPTQTAILHEGFSWHGVRPGLMVSSVREALSLFQTTSPSYPLLAGIDAAVRWASESGAEAYLSLVERLDECRKRVHGESRFSFIDPEAGHPLFVRDPTRLVIQARNAGIKLESWLRESCGVFAEMADMNHVVLIATPFHDAADFTRLTDALRDAPECGRDTGQKMDRTDAHATDRTSGCWIIPLPSSEVRPEDSGPFVLPERVVGLQRAVRMKREAVPILGAIGRIAAGTVVPYPPGVVAIAPGERFDSDLVTWLVEQGKAGISVLGMEDGCVSCIMEEK